MIGIMYRESRYERVFERSSRINKGVPFVFSMTEKRDSLNQWRSYGNGDYCIEIDVKSIIDKPNPIKLVKVVYKSDDNSEDEDLKKSFDRFFDNYLKGKGPGDKIDPEVYQDGMEDIIIDLWRTDFFVKHKDHAFHEEKEWRFVVYVDVKYGNTYKVYFRANGRYPKPYIKVKPFEGDFGLSNAITEILCGPGLDHELCRNSVAMLRSFRTGRSPRISFSNVPYRVD